MNKQLQPDCVVSANLQNLAKELWEDAQRNGGTVTQSAQAIAFKINSCLYREYPISSEAKMLNRLDQTLTRLGL